MKIWQKATKSLPGSIFNLKEMFYQSIKEIQSSWGKKLKFHFEFRASKPRLNSLIKILKGGKSKIEYFSLQLVILPSKSRILNFKRSNFAKLKWAERSTFIHLLSSLRGIHPFLPNPSNSFLEEIRIQPLSARLFYSQKFWH